ncbi:hypothetical protein [Flavobacterium sp. 140616W15]|uniref:hypothetical protein n=1 Tax=Flavobacterium sp. 140616W15 TaxID=2478552 RepID=UPI000F0C08C0|nr:hypothetical protein [Flavobacterium sp. 140616W15]AYN04413.1 hypothetical protein EAG11_09655 [Flavobacterium sp. 140616W15]
MKYIIECNKCNSFFEIFEEGILRIEVAKKNKWSSILFVCPHCNQQTSWNRLTEIHNNSNLLTQSKDGMEVEIDKDLLPKDYYTFRINTKKNTICISKKRNDFNLYSLEELFKEVFIDKNKFVTIFQLQGYLKSMLEVGVEFKEKEISLLENALSIGEENGDILFIDKREENSNLYIFYPDGGDIDKLKLTLNDIVSGKQQ